jgi:hypothetical protein
MQMEYANHLKVLSASWRMVLNVQAKGGAKSAIR